MHSTGSKKNACRKIVCYATFPCQRKMHADYPSVAKPCTSIRPGCRPPRALGTNLAQEKTMKSQRLKGFYSSERPYLTGSFRVYTAFPLWISLLTQALAPKMLGLFG